MRSLILLAASALLAADPTYIVHWTSQEPCHECGFRYAVGCLPNTADCGVPMRTVNHIDIADSKDAALKIANSVAEFGTPWRASDTAISDTTNGTISSGWISPYPPKAHTGQVVAIYEARPLPIKIKTEQISTPQPPTTSTKTTVSLDKSK